MCLSNVDDAKTNNRALIICSYTTTFSRLYYT